MMKVFHGTPNIDNIIESGAVYCPSLSFFELTTGTDVVFKNNLESYLELTSVIASAIRDNPRDDTAKRLIESGVSDEVLISKEGAYFSGSGIGRHKELARNLHVFLSTDYNMAAGYIDKFSRGGGGIFEFDLPEEIFREEHSLASKSTLLVRRSVPLEYMTAVHVDSLFKGVTESLLKKKGYNAEVKTLVKRSTGVVQ